MGGGIADFARESYSRLFSSLYSRFRDMELVEDGIQDAIEKLLGRRGNPPRDTLAWLYTAAKNRILDTLKSKAAQLVAYAEEIHGGSESGTDPFQVDEQLRLMCLCCHPALGERVQILLTLKLVAGLTSGEIAAALVMKKKSVEQALTRAKEKIRIAGIPFRTPEDGDLTDRLSAIRKTVYLMFNEGYHSNSGQGTQRPDLCNEAIRLARLLVTLSGADSHPSLSLLALLLYQNSRRRARFSDDGEPILLKDQDRNLWDRDLIREAHELFEALLPATPNKPNEYFFQAAIAREYARAPGYEESNWPQICRLYADYYYAYPNPVVLLSWIGAESQRSTPRIALELMKKFDLHTHLKDYRWFYSVRGELRAKTGDAAGASADLSRALSLAVNPGERRLLERRLGEIDETLAKR